MNTNFKLKENQKGFDFAAIKILFSVIAILLSVTLPNSLAAIGNSETSISNPISRLLREPISSKSHAVLKEVTIDNFCAKQNSNMKLKEKLEVDISSQNIYCKKPILRKTSQ